jgi:hypothetical protein
MAIKIPQGFMAKCTIGNFRDAAGHATVIDAVTSITVSDPTKCEILTIGADTFVAPLMTGDPIGDGQQVLFAVDVRVGPDVNEVVFMAEFDVPAGEAALADAAIGEVVARP